MRSLLLPTFLALLLALPLLWRAGSDVVFPPPGGEIGDFTDWRRVSVTLDGAGTAEAPSETGPSESRLVTHRE